jgi:hypothetical protein
MMLLINDDLFCPLKDVHDTPLSCGGVKHEACQGRAFGYDKSIEEALILALLVKQ